MIAGFGTTATALTQHRASYALHLRSGRDLLVLITLLARALTSSLQLCIERGSRVIHGLILILIILLKEWATLRLGG